MRFFGWLRPKKKKSVKKETQEIAELKKIEEYVEELEKEWEAKWEEYQFQEMVFYRQVAHTLNPLAPDKFVVKIHNRHFNRLKRRFLKVRKKIYILERLTQLKEANPAWVNTAKGQRTLNKMNRMIGRARKDAVETLEGEIKELEEAIGKAEKTEQGFMDKLTGKGEEEGRPEDIQKWLEKMTIEEGRYDIKRQEFIKHLYEECEQLRQRLETISVKV